MFGSAGDDAAASALDEKPYATRPPRFGSLEAILVLGVGFVIHPLVDAVFRHDWTALAAGIAYLVIAGRRIAPRLDSLSEHPVTRR